MENKKYLDKVIDHMVKGTKIDYENGRISFPFLSFPSLSPSFLHFLPPSRFSPPSFSKYCKNTFGLTGEEMEYVWNQYGNIIKDKIENER